MDRHEEAIIRETLESNDGDVAATLQALGIARKTFYDKLTRYGINRADYKRR
jgi:two-component system C4-dicarboxylate transport response regulator DctD